MSERYRDVLARLGSAQKGAARGAPAYSRFVNRRLGRVLAAAAYQAGMTPNQVTMLSAAHTFAGIALLALFPVSWWLGVVVCLLLVLGYAWDSADGQVARLTGTGSSAGEWLDHVVDSIKVVALPCALLIGLYRAGVADSLLLIPVLSAVVSSVMFFAMILTEQLRRAHGVVSTASSGGRLPWLRSVIALPTDYGVLCLSFLLYGATPVFLGGYGLLTLASAAFLALALPRWFREIRALGRAAAPVQ